MKGTLRPGCLADLVLLSEDIEAIRPENIGQVEPLMTVCDGRVVHEK